MINGHKRMIGMLSLSDVSHAASGDLLFAVLRGVSGESLNAGAARPGRLFLPGPHKLLRAEAGLPGSSLMCRF